MLRQICLLALFMAIASALQLPNLQPFFAAIPISISDYIPPPTQNDTASGDSPHQNLKRQYSNTCPSGFGSCANIGGNSLCCSPNAICSADNAGHVACCPSGAACTGTISGVITAGTVDSSGNVIAGGAAATGSQTGLASASATTTTTQAFQTASSTAGNGLVVASTQSTAGSGTTSNGSGGFVLDGTSTVATPGAAVRGAEIPLVARALLRLLEYIQL